MISNKFTILELTDLALRVPEIGSVNFNILHTVLTAIISELGLENVKTPCQIEDEAMAQLALTKNRLNDKSPRRPSSGQTIESLKEKIKDIGTSSTSEEEESDKHANIEELKKVAEDLMEKGAEAVAEKAEAVSDALKVLTDEDLLQDEPAKVIEELWRATNINRRMDGAEAGLRELASLVDELLNKMQNMGDQGGYEMEKSVGLLKEMDNYVDRIEALENTLKSHAIQIKEYDEIRTKEVMRLEDTIDERKIENEETKSDVEVLHENHEELVSKVAYKEELKNLKFETQEKLDEKVKDVKDFVKDVESTLTKKSDFNQMATQVDVIEVNKVDRTELGQLVTPGFLEGLVEDISDLRKENESQEEKIAELDAALEALKTMMQMEIIEVFEKKFADIMEMLKAMNDKLDKLDPDEINDSFANLEEEIAMLMKDLEELKQAFYQLQKESRHYFGIIVNTSDLVKKLETNKVDKSRLNKLLELKADVAMVTAKLDRAEFASVIGDIKDNLERLTISVKINEEEMSATFLDIRHELTLKMYTEDFITATQPIRNRIKALIYELERVKQIALTHLFPDAPGIAKCISCKRRAHLAGPKYLGDANIELLEEVTPGAHIRMAIDKSSKTAHISTDSEETSNTRLPVIDLESVPIPPPDKPREKNALHLPVLFATARPQIGLTHERRRKAIDKKLDAYFASRAIRPIGGEYTRTHPQQRGLDFTAVMLPQSEKEEVLLEGINENIYRGAVYEGFEADDIVQKDESKEEEEPIKKEHFDIKSLKAPRTKKGFIKPVIKKPTKEKDRDDIIPSTVSLHVNNEPLQKTSPLPNITEKILLPSHEDNKKPSNHQTKPTN